MKIAIITSVSGKSAKELAEHLRSNNIRAEVFKPFDETVARPNWSTFDHVFSYGCSASTENAKNRLNKRKAVLTCVDKTLTFAKFAEAGVPTVRHWTARQDVPADVSSLVIRQDRKGRKAEDLSYWDRDSDEPIPIGDLYSEWFEHKREYRLTVFRDQAFLYLKRYDAATGMHEFILSHSPLAARMKQHAIAAAVAIGIDYVSFDVLANNFNNYVFLEANSGSILTEEVSMAIVEYFLNLE